MAWRNIVVTQHCKVSMKMNLLVVQTDDDTVQIPIDDIGMVLFATTQAVITTSAMASLLERDIKVVFCNDKHLPIGETNPYETESSRRVCIVQQMGWVNICSFQGHCYCRRRPIALFDDYCGSRPPLLRIKATGC